MPGFDDSSSHVVRVGRISLHYKESGSGRPVVLVHGFGQSSFCWRHLHGCLPGHRLIAPDLKGFGRSDKPRDGKYGPDDQAELVLGFTDALRLGDFVLVGHSFGGAVCLRAAQLVRMEGAGRVRGMVLVDSAAYRQAMPDFIRLFRTPVLAEVVLWLVPMRLGSRLALRRAYFDGRAVTTEAAGAYAHAVALPGGRQALLATARQIVPEGIGQIVGGHRQIDIPTLIIWGEHDTIVPLAIGERLANEMPKARLETMTECGHVPQEERPEVTVRLISGFLSELDGCE